MAERRIAKDPHSNDSEERLLASATQLFADQGFVGTSISDITSSANLTKGAFYHYFESKEYVLFEIYRRIIEDSIEQMRIVCSKGLSPQRTLENMIMVAIQMAARNQAEVTIFSREMDALSEPRLQKAKTLRDEYEHYYRSIIQQGREAGEFRSDLDPSLVTFFLLGMIHHFCTWYRPEGRWRPDEIGERMASTFLRGLVDGVDQDWD